MKKENRQRGDSESGFRVIRVIMCLGSTEGRMCLREVWSDFEWGFWMA